MREIWKHPTSVHRTCAAYSNSRLRRRLEARGSCIAYCDAIQYSRVPAWTTEMERRVAGWHTCRTPVATRKTFIGVEWKSLANRWRGTEVVENRRDRGESRWDPACASAVTRPFGCALALPRCTNDDQGRTSSQLWLEQNIPIVILLHFYTYTFALLFYLYFIYKSRYRIRLDEDPASTVIENNFSRVYATFSLVSDRGEMIIVY